MEKYIYKKKPRTFFYGFFFLFVFRFQFFFFLSDEIPRAALYLVPSKELRRNSARVIFGHGVTNRFILPVVPAATELFFFFWFLLFVYAVLTISIRTKPTGLHRIQLYCC